jgi:hypothetical protein|tara:strand:+ start:1056 stop:1502 length:447 start_codon:yes stop_codon:yes gene_type:complete
MSKSALKFGTAGLFGRMGNNPGINSLTNANALAAQQATAGQANLAMQAAAQPVGSGMVMDASMPTFDPSAQMAGMGIFGAKDARNRSLYPSAIMLHDEELIKNLKAEITDIKANGEDSKFLREGEEPQDAVYERQSRISQEKKKHEKQ